MNNGANEVWAALKVALTPHPIHHLCLLMLVSTHPSALFKFYLQQDICLLSVIGTTFLKLTIHIYMGQISHSCLLACLFQWLKASKRRGNHSDFFFFFSKKHPFLYSALLCWVNININSGIFAHLQEARALSPWMMASAFKVTQNSTSNSQFFKSKYPSVVLWTDYDQDCLVTSKSHAWMLHESSI